MVGQIFAQSLYPDHMQHEGWGMADKKIKTQYTGVRYREHKKRKHNGKADRYYTIFYKLNGKTKEEGLGWASEGWTAQQASIQLSQLRKAQTTGEGAPTLRDQRENAEKAKEEEATKKAQEKLNRITLNEVAPQYLDWAKRNKKSWNDDAARLRMHVLPLLGDYPLLDIDFPEIEMMKAKCQDKSLAPATIVQCLGVTRAIFYFAVRYRLFNGINPVKGVKFPKVDNRRVRFLSKEEAKALLKLASSYNMEIHDMCLICLYTGMRAGEMISLRWSDVDFRHELITVRDTKNGETRLVFMTRSVKEMLQKRRKAGDLRPWVFPANTGTERVRVSKIFQRLVDKLRLNEGVTDRRFRVCFHTLRHTFASWLAMQGETLLTIKELMGHKTIIMTMRYAHLIPDHKRQAVDKLEESFQIKDEAQGDLRIIK
jgi:integrase